MNAPLLREHPLRLPHPPKSIPSVDSAASATQCALVASANDLNDIWSKDFSYHPRVQWLASSHSHTTCSITA